MRYRFIYLFKKRKKREGRYFKIKEEENEKDKKNELQGNTR